MRPAEDLEVTIGGSLPALTPLQEHYLTRLHYLVAKRAKQIKADPKDTFSLRLLARALYATYMDCVANGIHDQAADVMDKAQQGMPSAAHGTGVTKSN